MNEFSIWTQAFDWLFWPLFVVCSAAWVGCIVHLVYSLYETTLDVCGWRRA